MEPNAPTQQELFTVEAVQGYATLGSRERRFVQALFEGCNQTEAARAAGVKGSEEYIRKAAHQLAHKGSVQAVMNQAWVRAGASIDGTLKQAAELQQRTFSEAITAETPERRKLAFAQWKDASALIASIHGKLTLKLDGTLTHKHEINSVTVPADALPALAQLRRDVVTARNQNVAMPGGN